MRVIIKNMKHNEVPINVKSTDKIEYGKKLYGKDKNIVWTFMAKVLSNDKTFGDYDIEEDDVITSTDKVIGGQA
jgi:hypothetical protein